jgi:hypothetical protein
MMLLTVLICANTALFVVVDNDDEDEEKRTRSLELKYCLNRLSVKKVYGHVTY